MYINNNVSSTRTSDSYERKPKDMLGKDDFLELLTTQLRYQDPINPVEDKAFVAQLAQFSSLEQMQNLNKNMQEMMQSQQQLTALGQAMAMVGKVVEIHSHEGEQIFGRVSGVQFSEGWPLITVDGKLFDFGEVVAISEGSGNNGE